jgi:hypothetical protein
VVIGFITTYAISAYHHKCCKVELYSRWKIKIYASKRKKFKGRISNLKLQSLYQIKSTRFWNKNLRFVSITTITVIRMRMRRSEVEYKVVVISVTAFHT